MCSVGLGEVPKIAHAMHRTRGPVSQRNFSEDTNLRSTWPICPSHPIFPSAKTGSASGCLVGKHLGHATTSRSQPPRRTKALLASNSPCAAGCLVEFRARVVSWSVPANTSIVCLSLQSANNNLTKRASYVQRDRETDRERQRQTERERERQRHRGTPKYTHTHTHAHPNTRTHTCTPKYTHTHPNTLTHTHSHTHKNQNMLYK